MLICLTKSQGDSRHGAQRLSLLLAEWNSYELLYQGLLISGYPKGCLRRIEKLCSRFLWTGDVESAHGTKVAWTVCCLPKEEGGLGLRRFTTWNSVLSLRFFWLLVSDSQSLWVKWHRHHHIKDASIWLMKQKPSNSWTWNALLGLKHLAERFVSYKVNNGLTTKFWLDAWTPFGNLMNYIGEGGPRQFRVPLHTTVAEVCSNGYWNLPSPRSENAMSLHIYLTTIPVPDALGENDSVLWHVNGSAESTFSAAKTWEVLRPSDTAKPWASVIWFKGAILKMAFNMWVAHLNRLPTRARISRWSPQTSPLCCLCNTLEETRDHLFITCDYSAAVWSIALSRLNRCRNFVSWSELMSWIRVSSARAPSTLRKVAAQATVYHLWKQRNNVLHNNVSIPAHAVFRLIDKEIRNIISARKDRNAFHGLMLLWLA